MSPLLVIFVTVFIDLLGFGLIIPLLPFYAEHFGASALIVGLLSTSFSLMQFLFAPFWGRLSDRIGRRPVILIGLIGSALSYSLFALASSLPMLFVARCLAGIAGANIPTAQAFIADITTKENRARGMGMVDRLATRLKQNGDDVEGWLRLLRAYMVMGERDKAASALVEARQAVANDAERLRQLNEGAKNLGLDG